MKKPSESPTQSKPSNRSDEWEEDARGNRFPNPEEAFKMAVEDQLRVLDEKATEETGKPSRHRDKKKIIREAMRSASGKLRSDLERKYSEYVLKRTLLWPPKWIIDFRRELRNERARSKFNTYWRVFDCRWQHSFKDDWKVDQPKSMELAGKIKFKKRGFHIFQDPAFDLKEMQEELGLSKVTIIEATDFWEFVGAVKKAKHRTSREVGSVYATGWWHWGKGGWRAIPYLSQKKCETRMREFFWTWERKKKQRPKAPEEKRVSRTRFEELGLTVEFVKPAKREPDESN